MKKKTNKTNIYLYEAFKKQACLKKGILILIFLHSSIH